MELVAGSVLQMGKYVLAAPLGKGSFGVTYRAARPDCNQAVAIKTLDESLRSHPNFDRFRQQFLAEAQKISRCQHPSLVRILDCFEEGGQPFMVMEYVPGPTLATLVQPGQPLPENVAIRYIRQVGEALSVLHQQGILHRDVKPQNIVRRQGTDIAVLTDFGIARELTLGMAQTHMSMLSAGYAAPEQYLSQTKRLLTVDIYALAATLYCLLVGQAPIVAPLRDRIPLLDLRIFQPNLTSAVEQAVFQGLSMDPQHRPQTVNAWLASLSVSNAQPVQQQRQTHNATQFTPRPKLPIVPPTAPPPTAMPAAANPEPIASDPAEPLPVRNQAMNESPSSARSIPHQPNRWLGWALLMTAAIAGTAGAGFGLAVRTSTVSGPIVSIPFLETEQTFPPREEWPISESANLDLHEPVRELAPARKISRPHRPQYQRKQSSRPQSTPTSNPDITPEGTGPVTSQDDTAPVDPNNTAPTNQPSTDANPSTPLPAESDIKSPSAPLDPVPAPPISPAPSAPAPPAPPDLPSPAPAPPSSSPASEDPPGVGS